MLRKYILLCLAAALLAPGAASFADDGDLQDQLADVQSRMSEQSEKKAQAEAVIGSVNDKLYEIQKNLETAEGEYKAVSEDLAATEAKITAAQDELEANQARLEKRQAVFSRRIRDIYMHGQLNYLDVVLGARDFSDFSNRLELLRRILSADIQLLSDIRQEQAAIREARAELEAQRSRQAALKEEAKAKRDEIAAHKKENEDLLYQAQYDKATAEKAYEEYQQASQSIADMLRQRAANVPAASADGEAKGSDGSSAAASGGSGGMIWPVNGTVTSPYGYRTHPIFGTAIYHSGIDIGVDYGTPVQAAAGGTVVEASWISGYGYSVIIDHGGGLSTLYGHNQELAVSAGQQVAQGQVIAYAGSTGNSTGPHVHFEVRSGGEPVDPNGYL